MCYAVAVLVERTGLEIVFRSSEDQLHTFGVAKSLGNESKLAVCFVTEQPGVKGMEAAGYKQR